jgi:hypothetical protein
MNAGALAHSTKTATQPARTITVKTDGQNR